jgi:hypothetical protein
MSTFEGKIRDRKSFISKCQRREKFRLTLVYPFCVAIGNRLFLWCNVLAATITKQRKENNKSY